MRVLFLDLDTLRPDHLGCYGYRRNTSPNIDTIANKGVRFTNYHCSDAPCLPSRAAMMSGRFGIHNGAVGHGGTAGDLRLDGPERGFADRLCSDSLPSIFRRAGHNTVSISPFAERHGYWPFYAGFSEIHNTGYGGVESAEQITPTVMKWIESNAKEDNWFLHVNYWDPHTPYRAPEDFGNPFENEPLPEWMNQDIIDRHRNMVGPHGIREINMYNNNTNPKYPRHLGEIEDMADWRKFVDGYDCGIRYMDDHIGMLLEAIGKYVPEEELAIIVSSDHGENLGELELYAEHATADGITPHIPMIIKWPGCKEGHVDVGMHYNIDLCPTLADLLGVSTASTWDGSSYAGTLTDGNDCGREYLVLSQCAHTCQRGVRFDDWIYIRTYHDFYHLWPKEMLFNLKDDPHEQYDLAEERKDICMRGAYYLMEWHDEMMLSMPDGYDTDPLWTVMKEGGPAHSRGFLKDYTEYLKQTGREWAIPELKKRHPGEWK